MRLSDFPVLADQNVREAVVEYLRGLLFDVVSAREGSLPGSTDEDLYELAVQQGRVIVTHDRDFGRLAVFEAVHPPGIVYVRPGHLDTSFTIRQLEGLLSADVELSPPFIIVVDQLAGQLRIRVRSLGGN